MRTSLGYPDHDTTVALLADASNRNRSAQVRPMVTAKAVAEMAALAGGVHTDMSVLAYISRIAEETRRNKDTKLGVSMRGCLSFVRAAKTWAAAHGRTFVLPDDVKELALPVLAHRVLLTPEAEFGGITSEQVIGRVLADVAPPTERLV